MIGKKKQKVRKVAMKCLIVKDVLRVRYHLHEIISVCIQQMRALTTIKAVTAVHSSSSYSSAPST